MTATRTAQLVTVDGLHLRRYVEHPALSQETIAFDAQVFDGETHIADLTNSGEGGACIVSPVRPADHRAVVDRLEAPFPVLDLPMTVADVLAALGALARDLAGRGTVSFAPNASIADLICDEAMSVYRAPASAGTDRISLAEHVLELDLGFETLTFPVRSGRDVWLHTLSR